MSTWFILCTAALRAGDRNSGDRGLIGYWKLRGDCRDSSGYGRDGVNYGVNLETSKFDGRDQYIKVADSSSLDLGRGNFSVSAWVYTARALTDYFGDIVTKFDRAARQGFNLSLGGNTSGYNSQSDIRQLFFGLDSGTSGTWVDCGRPHHKTHISDAATVFNGDLYVGTTDAPDEADWAHVFRFRGGENWEDLGRVGSGRTRGVYALVVHDRELYAATSASHNTQPPDMDFGRVYRYRGGREWEDIGQPGENYRLNALASFHGRLYVAGFNIGANVGHCYTYEGGRQWRECGSFKGYPHTLAVHDGRLYTAYPNGQVFSYEGGDWENLGNPFGSTAICNQIHSMGVYAGELYVGAWPAGRIAVRRNSEWIDLGALGDATEVVGIAAYNGSLYAGTIPRAEVFRFDGSNKWTSIRRLFNPPGFEPVPINVHDERVKDWSRASSLTVYQGRLFATTATCYRRFIDSPLPDEIRGKVYSFAAGAAVSYDQDLGAGWKHVAAVRAENRLLLYVDGKRVAAATADGDPVDVSNDVPLCIGFGPQSHFCGRIRDVRLYNRALADDEIQSQHRQDVSTLKPGD